MQRTDHLGRLACAGHRRRELLLRLNQTHGYSCPLQFFNLLDLLSAARGRLGHERLVLLLGMVLFHIGQMRFLGQIRHQRPDE